MAEDQDGQQITVAELLKRMGAEQPAAATGRRHRRADEGSGVSVSELTGEIPRITDDTVLSSRAARRRAREAEEAQQAAGGEAGSTAGASTPATAAGASQKTPETTTTKPAGAPPVQPRRSADRPATPAASAPVKPAAARPAAARPAGSAAPGTPGAPVKPAAQAPAAAQQPTPESTSTDRPAESDAHADPAKKGGRRGLFGRKRKDEQSSSNAPGVWQPPAGRNESDPGAAGAPGTGTVGVAGTAAAAAGAGAVAGAAAAGAATPKRDAVEAGPAKSESAAPVKRADAPTASVPTAPAVGPATTPAPTPAGLSAPAASKPATKSADKPAAAGESSKWGVPSGSGSTAHRGPDAPTEQTDAPTEQTDAPVEQVAPALAATGLTPTGDAAHAQAVQGQTTAIPAAPVGPAYGETPAQSDASLDHDPDYAADEADPAVRSSATQWLVLVAQVLASAVAGAALFIGFQLLWRDLSWVAMALAVVVIVGLVAMVRVLRRSNDTVSIALAVIVGLGVTCGPLLLRVIA